MCAPAWRPARAAICSRTPWIWNWCDAVKQVAGGERVLDPRLGSLAAAPEQRAGV